MPPDKRTGPRGQGAGTVEQGRVGGLDVILDDPTDDTPVPRWTGCPAGCPLDHHEHDWLLVSTCNYCGALSVAERDALPDCSSVCPMRTVAS